MSDQNDPNAAGTPDLSALLGGAAGGGGMDFSSLMEQAQQMLAGAQEVAAEVVEGSSGGGMVKVEVDGGFTRVPLARKVVEGQRANGLLVGHAPVRALDLRLRL